LLLRGNSRRSSPHFAVPEREAPAGLAMGQDGQQIRRDKLIIDTDPGIGASHSLPPPPFLCLALVPCTIVSFL
jgi:hypothetical protein